MSFLAPLFLLGGLAIAVPVIFHLVRRSSRERLVFSSLMFLKPTPPRMTRRNRLENIFLLLLRCLAICLLALGFARPFFRRPMPAAPSGNNGAQIVLLVDKSASMRRDGLWAEAMAKARAVLNKTTTADELAVLLFDNRIRTVVSFEQWSAMNPSDRVALISESLAKEEPSLRSTHLGNALIAAAEIIVDAEKQEQPMGARRIVVVTDLQEGSRLDSLQGHEWPDDLEVVVEPVNAKRTTNAGLQWVMNTEEFSGPAGNDSIRIRVSNSSDATREQFQIGWGDVPTAASLDAYVPPGQSRIVPAPKLPAEASGQRVVLKGDEDDFDNAAYIVQPKPEQVKVLFMGDDSEVDPSQLLYYLKRAFRDTRRQSVRLEAFNQGNLASELQGCRLVILSQTLSEESAGAVRQYLSGGGSALIVMNGVQVTGTLAQLIGLPQLRASEANVSDYAMFGELDFTHPLLAPFADPRFGDFTKVRFWKHRQLSESQIPNARVIARFDDQDPAILEIPLGRGRVWVFTFSWRPVDSQFALSSKFVPLLYSLLDQAGGVSAPLAQFRVGDDVDLTAFETGSEASVLSVRKPDGSQVQLPSNERHFIQTDQPGIYKVVGARSPIEFAVNLDAAESKTAPLSVEELERLGVPMKASRISPVKPVARMETLRNAEIEARQKLWRWLILAALAVLLIETWLAGWITRRTAYNAKAAA